MSNFKKYEKVIISDPIYPPDTTGVVMGVGHFGHMIVDLDVEFQGETFVTIATEYLALSNPDSPLTDDYYEVIDNIQSVTNRITDILFELSGEKCTQSMLDDLKSIHKEIKEVHHNLNLHVAAWFPEPEPIV